jgi:YD repeat-containing protein
MKIKKIALLFLGVNLCCMHIKSQPQNSSDGLGSLKNVIPPSPNASSLGKYGDWPVSLYTGLPNISIPLYELKGHSLSVPVSISYHAAGNKVGEIASSVGLGWSMQSGGMISRSIRGLPDEDAVGGFFAKQQLYSNPNDMCSTPIDVNAATEHKVQSAKGLTDSEQDVYSFSAMGRSFKFFIKADGSMIPMPYSKVRLTSNFSAVGAISPESVNWTAVFEDGMRLEFGGSGFCEMTTNPRYDNGVSLFVTSWLLKKITSATGEEVLFTYTSANIDQDSYFSESDALKYNLNTVAADYTSCAVYIVGGPGSRKKKTERQQVTMLQLASIENAIGRIEFEQAVAEREDVKGGRALVGIKVFSKRDNRYLTKYKLNQIYSQSETSNEYWGGVLEADKPYYRKRLKLVNIEKYSGDDIFESRWVLEYNPLPLPSRRSYAQDHWGFYNGLTSNNTLLPKFFYPLPSSVTQNFSNAGFNAPDYEVGVSREGNGTYAQAEMLQSIKYPTGGSTSFYFEPNSIPISEEQFAVGTKIVSLDLTELSNPFTTSNEQAFTVTTGQNVMLVLDAYMSPDIIEEQHSSKITVQIVNTATQAVITGISTTVSQSYTTKRLNINTPGNYVIRVSTNVEQASFTTNLSRIQATASVQYQQSQGFATINKNTGGLRLQKMIMHDAVNTANNIEKSFVYENPLIINPVDLKAMYFTETEELTCENVSPSGSGNGGMTYLSCHNRIVTRNSSTRFSLGSVQGGTVGYGKVTTLYGTGGSNGKSVSLFTNEQDAGLDMTVIYPFVPSDSREHRRGLLLCQTDYDAAGTAVSKIENNYEFLPRGTINQFKAGFSMAYSSNVVCSAAFCNDINGNCGIQQVCYGTTVEQVKQTASTRTEYNVVGNIVNSTLSYYDNPDNPQPTRTETTNSKGELIKQINRSPLEKVAINAATPLTPSASTAIDSMLARNIISPVLQTETWKGTNMLSRNLVNYRLWDATMVQPEYVQVQKGNNPVEIKLRMNAYDSNGNLLEQQKESDVLQCYIWGYGKMYPVAQIVGANYATASAFINQTVLDNPLSTEQQIRDELNKIRIGLVGMKAQVITYTYTPLVGISSQTDPTGKTIYYEYDAFNRLKAIKDKDGNIVKAIEYKYNVTGQ